jgi:hypothetical protein
MVVCDTCFTMHDRRVDAAWRVRSDDRNIGEACMEHLAEFLRGNLHRLSRTGPLDGFHVIPLRAQTGE